MSLQRRKISYLFIIIAFLLCIYIASYLRLVSASLPVNMTLNGTQVWWQDAVNASGYTNATKAVTVFQGNIQACSTTSAANGFWSCAFTAPTSIGIYTYTANTSLTDVSGSAALNVFPFYGTKGIGSTPRVVYEVPFIIQDLNGNIQKVFVRVAVSK